MNVRYFKQIRPLTLQNLVLEEINVVQFTVLICCDHIDGSIALLKAQVSRC